ncbi:hypothetical protein EWB00_004119, partial [Schistosoma japonicum]
EISMTNIASKILASVIIGRLTKTRELQTRENQAGFRPGRGCIDHIFTIRQVLEHRHAYRRPPMVVCLDLKAAFDSVDREVLWQCLSLKGVPQKYINLVKPLYSNTTKTVFSSLNDILALKYCFKADSNCSSYSCYGGLHLNVLHIAAALVVNDLKPENFSSELVDLQSILILFSKITDKSLITKEKLTKDYPTSIIFVRQTMKYFPSVLLITYYFHQTTKQFYNCLVINDGLGHELKVLYSVHYDFFTNTRSLSEKNLFQNHLETVVTMIL